MEDRKRKKRRDTLKSPISDTALFSRVREVYSKDPKVRVDRACETLCEAFKEYKRKPQAPFQKLVAHVLVYLREKAPYVELVDGDGDDDDDDNDEDDDEREADGGSDAPSDGGGDVAAARTMSLNSTLRRTYDKAKKKQAMSSSEPRSGRGSSASAPSSSGPRYADVGGIESCLQEVRELIEHPIRHPEIFRHLGIRPPTGVLLHGPPGTGKTMLAHAIANELGVPFLSISAPEIVSGFSGQSEKKIRAIFREARAKAPCLIFIDEVDAITPKRESAQREMERRIVAQLLTCLDELSSGKRIDEAGQDGEEDASQLDGENENHVIVIGATNRPDSLDPALRRAGRFDREICMPVPDAAARARILSVMCAKLRLEGNFDMQELARSTPGFVGADLVALTKEAAVLAVNRIFESLVPEGEGPAATRVSDHLGNMGPLTPAQLAPLSIVMDDFRGALKKVQPSSQREGFTTVPDVTWNDIGALEKVRAELQMSIVNAIRHPEAYASLGLSHPAGVLLYGPPGCGKTLLARAIAHECQASFISVKGPELLNKYVGESERAVRQVFQRARASAPCVVFFDEMDALAPRRGGESQASERVVNQLLTELDGLDTRRDVFVVAATNRPDIIDAAMLRPGRLEKLLYVPLPTAEDRVNILKTLTKSRPRLEPTVSVESLGMDPRCTGFSGADLSALVREASMAALAEAFSEDGGTMLKEGKGLLLAIRHFEAAFSRVAPSVSLQDAKRYESMQKQLSANRLSQ